MAPPFTRRALAAGGLATLLAACGGKKKKVPVAPPAPGGTPRVSDAAATRKPGGEPKPAGWTQEGVASWYGHPYHGRRAANGEIYDMEQFTAAHLTLPFGTWVTVENLTNGKSVDLRITDRGPFVGGRILDLSRAGARAIEMIGPGVARVRLTVKSAPSAIGEGVFAVQVGAFRGRGNAERLRVRMEKEHGAAKLVQRDVEPPLWRVLVGNERSESGATALAARLRASDADAKAAFVVRLD